MFDRVQDASSSLSSSKDDNDVMVIERISLCSDDEKSDAVSNAYDDGYDSGGLGYDSGGVAHDFRGNHEYSCGNSGYEQRSDGYSGSSSNGYDQSDDGYPDHSNSRRHDDPRLFGASRARSMARDEVAQQRERKSHPSFAEWRAWKLSEESLRDAFFGMQHTCTNQWEGKPCHVNLWGDVDNGLQTIKHHREL